MSALYIQTADGVVDIYDIEFTPTTVESLAHALSLINRFNGHMEWSVAMHSVLVSRMIEWLVNGKYPRLQLTGLLHDASECYVGDISAPLKRLVPKFNQIEIIVMQQIADYYQLEYTSGAFPPIVELADRMAAWIEAKQFFYRGNNDIPEWMTQIEYHVDKFLSPEMQQQWRERFIHMIAPVSPVNAQAVFLDNFDRLRSSCAQSTQKTSVH